MEWIEEKIIKLITSYKDFELLWNPKHKYYHNKLKKNTAWEEIAKEFNCQVPEIKKKIDSLLSSFRRERMKCITKSGCGRDEVYKSTWFAFNHMTFLLDKFQPRTTYNTNTFSENESSVNELIETQSDESNTESGEILISEDISNENNKNVANKTISSNISRSRKRSFSLEETRVSEAYNILKSTVETNRQKDNSDIFGDYIARKHRKYNVKTQSYVEHQISNILFQADMETYKPKTQDLCPLALQAERTRTRDVSSSWLCWWEPWKPKCTNLPTLDVAAGSVAAGPVAAGPVAARSVAVRDVAAGFVAAGFVAAGPVAADSVAAGSVAAGSISSKQNRQDYRPRGRAAGARRQQERFMQFLYQLSMAPHHWDRHRGRGRGRRNN
ncbi:uncharacterized protein [Linepithema humile]|uniref:uncharacterized protein n=1 Tax=Linepithema humile TaxID=83485 RepID=UPI00351E7B8C